MCAKIQIWPQVKVLYKCVSKMIPRFLHSWNVHNDKPVIHYVLISSMNSVWRNGRTVTKLWLPLMC